MYCQEKTYALGSSVHQVLASQRLQLEAGNGKQSLQLRLLHYSTRRVHTPSDRVTQPTKLIETQQLLLFKQSIT